MDTRRPPPAAGRSGITAQNPTDPLRKSHRHTTIPSRSPGMVKRMREKAKKKVHKFCVQTGCNGRVENHGYCRLHYIANWRLVKLDKHIKAERKLNSFVERLAKKYPADYLERLKVGLESEDKFKETVQEMALELEGDRVETEDLFVESLSRKLKVGG